MAFRASWPSRLLRQSPVKRQNSLQAANCPFLPARTVRRQGCTLGCCISSLTVFRSTSPRLSLSSGRILLRVATEVTEIDPTTVVAFQTANIPAMRTRKNETSVELPSGASIATAGPDPEQVAPGNQRSAGSDEPAGSGYALPLARLSAGGNRTADRCDAVYRQAGKKQGTVPARTMDSPIRPIRNPGLLGRVNRIYSTKSNPQLIRNFRGRIGFIND